MRSRSRFARRSSINFAAAVRRFGSGLLVVCAVASVGIAVAGFALGEDALLAAGLAAAALSAGALSLYLLETERRRHEAAEEELAGEARFLEAVVESIGVVTASLDPEEILERARSEAERLFDARATLLGPGESRASGPAESAVLVPLRVRDREIGALHLARSTPFRREEIVQATVLADFAARARENARLLDEAQVREAERARLSDQLITAEQDERRRLALFLHDTALQSLSGIALMLDAGLYSIEAGELEQAQTVIKGALERHRETIGSLRDLSFALEPVVLRDQGFVPAVQALAEQVGLERGIKIEVDVAAAEELAEKAQAALYQILREALQGAVHRGPPTRISLRVRRTDDGSFETVIADDAPGERRRRTYDAIAERARTVSGELAVEGGEDGGTTLRVTLPAYAAQH